MIGDRVQICTAKRIYSQPSPYSFFFCLIESADRNSLVSPARMLLEIGTPVKLQLAQTMSSAHAHKNDEVGFVVAEDVSFEGFTIIQAGAAALGSVVEVKRKRPLGMGGEMIIKLDWVELTTGERVELIARRKFKGRSHTVRMAVGMAITAAIYLPAAPVFLLTRGRDSEVLKGTELTAYTRSNVSLEAGALPMARKDSSQLAQMIDLLPPRVLNGEGREGDMLNLIFLAKENELQDAFSRAGWLKVEKSAPQIAWHLLWQRKALHEAADGQALRFWETTGLRLLFA